MNDKSRHKKNIALFIRWVLGPVLFCWLSWSIFQQLRHQPGLEQSWQHIKSSGSGLIVHFIIVILLMFCNWGIEALKWQVAVRRVQEVGFMTAFKAVLSGVSFSVTTPNRVGEYLGRVLYMEEGNRLRAISLTITGSLTQLLITLLMGALGIVFLRANLATGNVLSIFWLDVILYGTLGALVLLTLFYFRLSWLVRHINRVGILRKFAWLVEALGAFNATLLVQLLSLSALRFAVFIVQYYLLFLIFDVSLSWWQCWWAVSLSFLVMAVIPTIALFTDLGLRGTVSLKLIGLFSGNALGIGLTSVSIWFINLIVPALAGSLLILGIRKVFRDKNETGPAEPATKKDKQVTDEWNN